MRFCIWALLGLTCVALMPAGAGAAEPLPHYDMHVSVKPDALSVDAQVTLPAATEPRASLQFKLIPTMGTPDVQLIAPASAGALTVRKVKDEGDALKPRTVWEIDPTAPFPAGQTIVLHIRHSGGGGGLLVHYVGPEFTIASGIVQPWFAQFSAAKILGTLSLDTPSNFLAMASGERVSERVDGDRRETIFRMTVPMQINFAAGPFKVHRTVHNEGEIPVTLYLLEERDFAGDLVDIVRRSMATLEKEFGSAPYKEFALVEFPTGPGAKASFGGASHDGFMLMRSDEIDRRRGDPTFFGHEIGHQWWGVSISSVGGDGGDFMLDEALAEYGAIRVTEAVRGPEGAKAFRDDERDKIVKRIAAGYDPPLARIPAAPPSGSTFFDQDVVRSKGALVYDLIARTVGAERMRRFFHEIASEYGYSSRLTWHDFLARLKKAAGPQRRWLIDQWLNQKGLPVLDLKWTAQPGAVAVEIGQRQPGTPLYRLRMPVRLVYADGSADLRQVDVAAEQQTRAVLPVAKRLSRVELDPEHTVPWVTPEELVDATALKNFTLAWQLWDEGKGDEAEKILKTALDARTAPDPTPAEFLERYHYGWLLEENHKQLAEALEQWRRALELPVRPGPRYGHHLIQIYVNIARVATALGDKARARWAAEAALAAIDAGEQDSFTKRTRGEIQKYLN